MTDVLITGADGQLGMDCKSVLGARFRVTGADIDRLDISSESAVDEAVTTLRPDIILNCAAFTQVDACERQYQAAWQANSEGPANLARAAARAGARLVHISTDYVFDGKKPVPEPYTEADRPNPMSVYGSTKLAGEERIMEAGGDYVILRTAWLYGLHGSNFIRTILNKALNEPQARLSVVDDQYGSPTWSRQLAIQIDRLLTTGAHGLYHASAEGYGTWYELAAALLREMGISCRIDPCTTAEYPTPAARPKNSILENRRLKAEGINMMQDWQRALRQFLSEHGRELAASLSGKSRGSGS